MAGSSIYFIVGRNLTKQWQNVVLRILTFEIIKEHKINLFLVISIIQKVSKLFFTLIWDILWE
ncbi:hypothetical protein X298_01690 [Oenococcus oeni IOEB_L65_2]|nr:hypothetical protein X298_01690 [Oenococcus oeni IOEB_L65_2]